ncbi:hypothetical protein RIF29_33583 [Crotalaria pallida]|uniref:Uncharacterized protein n=1 Tax=Crotalaria pallida TaxID=3830 RepID=A0AAN9E7Y7_CROPI
MYLTLGIQLEFGKTPIAFHGVRDILQLTSKTNSLRFADKARTFSPSRKYPMVHYQDINNLTSWPSFGIG